MAAASSRFRPSGPAPVSLAGSGPFNPLGGATAAAAAAAAAGGSAGAAAAAAPALTASQAALLESVPLKAVQVEALALMKIIKHSAQQQPGIATGALVGIDTNGLLEVSNCFPFLSVDPSGADGSSGAAAGAGSAQSAAAADAAAAGAPRAKINGPYQHEMIKSLREVNVDANGVGWYMSTSMGAFVNANTIENQFFYQKEPNERTVALVHDVSRSAAGNLALRAFRLSPAFMAAYRDGKFTLDSLKKHKLKAADIFVELPVKIHNSHLATSLLHQLPAGPATDALAFPHSLGSLEANLPHLPLAPNLSGLEVTIDPVLEKNSDLLLDAVEHHQSEINNIQYYQRSLAREQNKITAWQTKRKAENAARAASKQAPLPEDEWQKLFKLPAEPSRLELLLNSRQVDQYANQMDGFTATISAKMFAVRDNIIPADRD